jgi:hypothetical protein
MALMLRSASSNADGMIERGRPERESIVPDSEIVHCEIDRLSKALRRLDCASSMSTTKYDSPRQAPTADALPEPPRPSHHCQFWRMKMNTKNVIAALAVLAVAGSAFANDVADVKGAQATSNYAVGAPEFVAPDAGFVSTKTRAQVVAELKQSVADGSYALSQQEFEGQSPAARVAASRLAGNGKAANLN